MSIAKLTWVDFLLDAGDFMWHVKKNSDEVFSQQISQIKHPKKNSISYQISLKFKTNCIF